MALTVINGLLQKEDEAKTEAAGPVEFISTNVSPPLTKETLDAQLEKIKLMVPPPQVFLGGTTGEFSVKVKIDYAAVFDLAAYLIEEFGWVQQTGQFGEARCASAAINTAAAELGFSEDGFHGHVAEEAVKRYTGFPNVPTWNDMPRRTQKQVVSFLRTLAENERRLRECLSSA